MGAVTNNLINKQMAYLMKYLPCKEERILSCDPRVTSLYFPVIYFLEITVSLLKSLVSYPPPPETNCNNNKSEKEDLPTSLRRLEITAYEASPPHLPPPHNHDT